MNWNKRNSYGILLNFFLVIKYLLAVCCFLQDAVIGIGFADPGILSVLWYFVFWVYFGSIIFLDINSRLNAR